MTNLRRTGLIRDLKACILRDKRRSCGECPCACKPFKRSGTMNERYGSVHRDREPEHEDFKDPRSKKGR